MVSVVDFFLVQNIVSLLLPKKEFKKLITIIVLLLNFLTVDLWWILLYVLNSLCVFRIISLYYPALYHLFVWVIVYSLQLSDIWQGNKKPIQLSFNRNPLSQRNKHNSLIISFSRINGLMTQLSNHISLSYKCFDDLYMSGCVIWPNALRIVIFIKS